jgi:putative Mg2+ transporter-C (MgtC) family protein
MIAAWGEPVGQDWPQVGLLGLALVLGGLIGLEREVHDKAAGLRTQSLVCLGAALFVLVSKYGFANVLGSHVALDPSRVAAQIVSGIGFLGGGLIFVSRDVVRGLTTAASVWLSAAVGAAAGADLPWLAVAVTGAHLLVAYGFRPISHRLGQRHQAGRLRLTCTDDGDVAQRVLAALADRGYVVRRFEVVPVTGEPALASIDAEVDGPPTADLVPMLHRLAGVQRVNAEQ